MKKSVYMCLYIGISYLFFDAFEAKGQVANTALSITLHPFLSISVNPVSLREIDARNIGIPVQMAYSYHQSLYRVVVGSNEAFEIRADHIHPPNNQTISLDVQLVRNWDKMMADTLYHKKFGLKVLEAKSAVRLANEKPPDIVTIEVFKYTLTAL